MAVIDIIRLPLIDANLQLEQNSTAVGRVWETFLQYVLTYAGILDVLWGRVVNHRRTVVLLLCWKDRYSRDRFHRGGLGTRMMDPYLERVIEVQFMVDVDVGQLAILAAGRVVLICSEDDTLGQNNGLTLPNLSQLDHFERLSGTGFQSQLGEKEKLSIEPLHVSFMVATTVDTSDLVTSELVAHARDGGWRAELIRPSKAIAKEFRTPSKRDSFPSLSALFVRDVGAFGNDGVPAGSVEMSTGGPAPSLTWSSPLQEFRHGSAFFQNRKAAPPPTERYSHLYNLPSTDHLQTVTLRFRDEPPALDDASTASGAAFRTYRKLLLAQGDCKKVWLVTDHDHASTMDVIIAWGTQSSSISFQEADKTRVASEVLNVHLRSALVYTSNEIGIRPSRDVPWAEVIDFAIHKSASESERRAFEYYIWDLDSTMRPSDGSSDQPVYPHHEGWLVGQTQSHIYRVVYYWEAQNTEALWVKRFVQTDYWLLGYKSHMVALVADSIRGRHVSIRRDRAEYLRDDAEDDAEEDLGF